MSSLATTAPLTEAPQRRGEGEGGAPVATPRRALLPNLRQNGITLALIAIVGVVALLTDGKSLGPENVTNLVLQYSYILILAIGMLVVIVSGHIDLSVGSVVALAGAVSGVLVIREGQPWWVGALAGVVVGLLAGTWHGFWVAVVRIPAWITTLAGMLLFRGLTLVVLGNTSLSPFPRSYTEIASGFQQGVIPGWSFDIFTLLVFCVAAVAHAVSQWRSRRAAVAYQQRVEPLPIFTLKVLVVGLVTIWFGWQLAQARGLPNILIILAVVFLAYSALMRKSVFGRNVYSIGGNLDAARLSGVKVRRVNFWIMTNMGMLSGLAGVAFASRVNGAQPTAGNSFELDAIAASFIGGAASTGGVGTVGGAMIGGLIMAVLSNGMQLLGMDQALQQVVKGAVLMIAVAFDIYRRRRAAGAR